MKICDLTPGDHDWIEQVAVLLVEGFKEHWPGAWPTVEDALAEVRESFLEDRISRVAVDDDGKAIGWIGGQPQYSGNVWELHPLVVGSDSSGMGVGSALVKDLERLVRAKGGVTLFLGTDDEDNMTSLAGKDLYTGLWEHIKNIRNLRRHPFEFYQKLGFVIVGVMPDANGPGKPDIYMAKRLTGA